MVREGRGVVREGRGGGVREGRGVVLGREEGVCIGCRTYISIFEFAPSYSVLKNQISNLILPPMQL